MTGRIFDVMFSAGYLQFFGAFLWGIASVLLSPCGISVIPLVVGYIANSESPTRSRAFVISCAFCLGIVMNLVLVAFVMSGVSMILGGYERFLTLITAGVFIVMGLNLLGVIRVKLFSAGRGSTGTESQDLKGALVLGVASGLALGPCAIAYVSPVLSLVMSGGSVMLAVCYALGYCAVLVFAGTFAQAFTGFLQSDRGSVILRVVNILCGIGLICGGVYLLREMWLLG